MHRIRGVIQHYEWGDTDVIPSLLGQAPDGEPWAEYWLGTHERGPAMLDDGRAMVDLTGPLPYLLKVLAAARPLSLQTHPDAEQAERGHVDGVFGDPFPKPELLCAITPVEALCGIRPAPTTVELFESLGLGDLAERVRIHGPGTLLHDIYRGRVDTNEMIAACATSPRREAHWVRELDAMYPGEVSVAATLLLNLVRLEPGQALRLDAGNLHAYLHGAGIELIGASDNVVRGGLTSKPVDVDLLLKIVDPTPLAAPVLPMADRYELPDAGVALLRLDAGMTHRAVINEIAIDDQGQAVLLEPGEVLTATTRTWVVTGI